MIASQTVCDKCHQNIEQEANSVGTGYAEYEGSKICYKCCAEIDKKTMIETGKITLYLICEPASKMRLNGYPFTTATLPLANGRNARGTISNWPGTLKFQVSVKVGNHNIAGVRYDVWFAGPDGNEWHGVTYGNNTQICHCRRLKKKD